MQMMEEMRSIEHSSSTSARQALVKLDI